MHADIPGILPTESEIADDSLDGRWAIKTFYGKTVSEAEELFNEVSPLGYTENFYHMNPVGFRYYILAAFNVALSDRACDESDLINGLAGAISYQKQNNPDMLVPCARLLADSCRKIYDQFGRYDADPEIYVGLREQFLQLAEHFTRVADEHGST